MHITGVTSCLIAFYNELSDHIGDGGALDVICLNLSNIFTIFTAAFFLEKQGVISCINVLSDGLKIVWTVRLKE